MMNERISSIMTINVMTVTPDEPVKTVRNMILGRGFHHIPVTEGKRLVGIVTSFDLMKKNPDDQSSVRDLMTTSVATLRPSESIGAAAQIFLKNLFHGLPIVDDDGDLVGIVTTHDILKYEFYKAYPDDQFAQDFVKWKGHRTAAT